MSDKGPDDRVYSTLRPALERLRFRPAQPALDASRILYTWTRLGHPPEHAIDSNTTRLPEIAGAPTPLCLSPGGGFLEPLLYYHALDNCPLCDARPGRASGGRLLSLLTRLGFSPS